MNGPAHSHPDTPITNKIIDDADAYPETRVVFLIKNLVNKCREFERALKAPLPESRASKIVCHAPGERCLGCAHYHGKAPICEYAQPLSGATPSKESISASPEVDALVDYYAKYGIVGERAYAGMCSRARQLERELNAARSTSGERWIDTKVRVPADGDDVLGYWTSQGAGDEIDVVHYYSGRWHDPDDDDDDYRAPEYWMSLPIAPVSAIGTPSK